MADSSSWLAAGFEGIAGHKPARDLLERQIASQRLPHAYLFAGEPMLGKTTVGRALAATLLPQAPLRRHPDYWEDDRPDALKIDEIRLLPDRQPEHHEQSLHAFLAVKPVLGEYRVALVSNVGRLADPVQGILLKTLEEPRPGRVIILTTPNLSPFVVLPTVVSRCQRVAFHAVPKPQIEAFLRGREVAADRIGLLADLARGRPGWAVRAAQDPNLLERHEQWEVRLDEVVGGPRDVALRLAADLDQAAGEWRRRGRSSSSRDQFEENPVTFALSTWQLQLRRRMIEETRPQPKAKWARLLERTYDVLGYLEQNVSPRLAVEVFLLEAR
jgi:DNA polymerase III subunit delta'